MKNKIQIRRTRPTMRGRDNRSRKTARDRFIAIILGVWSLVATATLVALTWKQLDPVVTIIAAALFQFIWHARLTVAELTLEGFLLIVRLRKRP